MKKTLFLTLLIITLSKNLLFLEKKQSAGDIKGLQNFNNAMNKIKV